jgi:two-component system, LytTR family, response regulator
MNNIKCVVLDDEPIASEIIVKFVKQISFLQLVAVAEEPGEAIKILQDNAVDLLISDIGMPGINGLQLIQSLPSPAPTVIFITAHENFAVNSFELDVVDYLLKPVSFERFLKAITKARLKISAQKSENHYNENRVDDGLIIKKGENLIKIKFTDIIYLQAAADFLKIFVGPSTHYVIHSTIKEIQQKIPSRLFVRIHNSYIAAIGEIKSVTKDSVRLSDVIELPLSRSHKKELLQRLDIYNT